MNDLARMTNQPIEIILGGKALKICAPTLAQEAEHELWLQRRYADIAGAASATPQERLQIATEAVGIGFYHNFNVRSWYTAVGFRQIIALLHAPGKEEQKLAPADVQYTTGEFNAVAQPLMDLIFPKSQAPTSESKPENSAS